jgi:hypothetical protein
MTIDFRKMFRVPAQVRQSIKFSLAVREEYRIQWDRFFMETPEFDQVSFSANKVLARTDDEPEQENIYIGETPSLDDMLSQIESIEASVKPSEEEEDEEEQESGTSGFALLRRSGK